MAAVTVSKPLFEASPACKAFTVETPEGKVLSIAELEAVEWTPLEDLAEEPEPDRLDELEDQINELQADKAAMLERLEVLEAAVKSYGKRKAAVIDDDDGDDECLVADTPQTASGSRVRRARK